MKHLLFAFAVVSLIGVPLGAAAPQSTPSTPPAAPTSKPSPSAQARPPAGTHVMNADFVAYDAKTKTVTVRDENGHTSNTPLKGRAVHEIGQLHLKNGDHVMLTYHDNAKGEHQAVIDIKPANVKT